MHKQYLKLVDDYASRPQRHHEMSEETKDSITRLRERLNRRSSTKKNGSSGNSSMLVSVKRIFSITVDDAIASLRGRRVLQDRVPLTKLRKAMRIHFLAITQAAFEKGVFVATRQVSDYRYLIDFGRGNVLDLYAVAHSSAAKIKTASVVEKTTTQKEFDRDELNFQLVPTIQPEIISADLHEVKNTRKRK